MTSEQQRAVVERAIDRARAAGADEADAVLVLSDSREARVRDQNIDFVVQSRERCLGIRALVRQNGGLSTAVTSTSDLSADAVDALASDTVTLARATAPDPAAGLPGSSGVGEEAPDLELSDPADAGASIEARIDDAREAEAAARATDTRIVNSEGSQVSSDSSRISYGSSAGFFGQYESASHSLFSEPVAREGESLQRDYWLTVGRSLAALEAPSQVGKRAAERALRRLGAHSVETCEVPVIFDSMTAASIVGHVAACVSGYSVYRETTYLAPQLGKRIANEKVTIIDDGRLPRGLGSKPFDGEGQPTRRNVVVADGELKTWLLDTYAGRKLGLETTGNASRGAGSAPGVGVTNLWMEPGDRSLDEMVASTSKGLLVTELIGMGFNPITGDYSRGAAGLWIEDGEIVHPVEEVTIAGNLGAMLEGIDQLGSELVWRGRIAAPPLRIESMVVAGSSA